MADRPVNNHKGIAKFLTYKGRISRKQFMIYHLYAFVVCITFLNLFLLAFPAWKLEALKGAVGLFCLISLFFWARRAHDLGWDARFIPVLAAANLVVYVLDSQGILSGSAHVVIGQGLQFLTGGLFMYLLMQPGHVGANAFGEDPVEEERENQKRKQEEFREFKKKREALWEKVRREQEKREYWKDAISGEPIDVEPVENKPVDHRVVEEYTEELRKHQEETGHHIH